MPSLSLEDYSKYNRMQRVTNHYARPDAEGLISSTKLRRKPERPIKNSYNVDMSSLPDPIASPPKPTAHSPLKPTALSHVISSVMTQAQSSNRLPSRSPNRRSIVAGDEPSRKRLVHAEEEDDRFASPMTWEKERQHYQAYEYLCHVGEAKEWIENLLGEDLGDTVSFPESLVNGVILAKVTKQFRPDLVKRIFEHPKLQYRHIDNINCFMDFIKEIKMPELFSFDVVDLYERRNLPKVIYCIHALSYILAQDSLAPNMGGLLGKIEFTDAELKLTQKNLDAAGLSLPNFKAMNRHFSKTLPEAVIQKCPAEKSDVGEVECTNSVSNYELELDKSVSPVLNSSYLMHFSALYPTESFDTFKLDGYLSPPEIDLSPEEIMLNELEQLEPEITGLQAVCMGVLVRKKHRRRQRRLVKALSKIISLQAVGRGQLYRHSKVLPDAECMASLQALARGASVRYAIKAIQKTLHAENNKITGLQSVIRSMFVRQHNSVQNSERLPMLQGAIRAQQIRRRLLLLDRNLEAHTALFNRLISASRGYLVRVSLNTDRNYLNNSIVTRFQAFARGWSVRMEIARLSCRLRAAEASVVKVQSAFRGCLARFEQGCVYEDLDNEILGIVGFQSRIRGTLVRRPVRAAINSWRDNEDVITYIQSRWRAFRQNLAYQSLLNDPNPSLSTIYRFLDLLTNSDHDYYLEFQLEKAQQDVATRVRKNELLKQSIEQLDAKVALMRKNRVLLDNVVRHRGTLNLGAGFSAQSTHVFDLNSVSKQRRQKLELYEGMFYILQTQPKYLAPLLAMRMSEKNAKSCVSLILKLFGNHRARREEFFLLQLMAAGVHAEVSNGDDLDGIVWRIVSQFNGAPEVTHALKSCFSEFILQIQTSPRAETDPLLVYQNLYSDECDANVEYVLQDAATRAQFVANLQQLRELTLLAILCLEQNVEQIPYHMRYLAREAWDACARRAGCTPSSSQNGRHNGLMLAGKVIVERFIVPALQNAEAIGLVNDALAIAAYDNLMTVSRVLCQCVRGEPFGEDDLYMQPLNEFVQVCSQKLSAIIRNIIKVPDLATEYSMSSLDDVAGQQIPTLELATNDVLALHALVFKDLDVLAPKSDTVLRPVVQQLGPPPSDIRDMGDIAQFGGLKLILNPSFGTRAITADSAGLMTTIKRCLIAVLHVQKGSTLFEVLIHPVDERDEELYRSHCESEPAASRNDRVVDLSTLTFRELKLLTLEKVLELESLGRISRSDGYQTLLDSLADDIRNKHIRRNARQLELERCKATIASLGEKHQFLSERLSSYTEFLNSTLATLQRQSLVTKTRSRMPFGKLFQKGGSREARFGSYRYRADQLVERQIIPHIKGYHERQYKDIVFTFKSDEILNFVIEAAYKGIMLPAGSSALSLDDLLNASYNGIPFLELFDRSIQFHTERLLTLILRKFFGAGE